jgi:hypothetical protein
MTGVEGLWRSQHDVIMGSPIYEVLLIPANHACPWIQGDPKKLTLLQGDPKKLNLLQGDPKNVILQKGDPKNVILLHGDTKS